MMKGIVRYLTEMGNIGGEGKLKSRVRCRKDDRLSLLDGRLG